MGRKLLEKVSQREYARRLGVSNEAVRKAVIDGRITKGWDKKEGKIIVEKANEEWGNIHIQVAKEGAHSQNEAIARVQALTYQQQPTKPAKPRFEDPEDTEITAFGELEQYNSLRVASDAQFAEALRVEKIAKARQEIIKLQELTGSLVNKTEVYKQLFGFGQSVRQAVLAVPDRCIDEVIAQTTRAEAHQILIKYLHEALEKITEADQMTFKQQETENT